MADVQRCSGNCSHAILKAMEDVKLPDNFPVGLKILVVDDDYTSLSLAKKMLLHCQYDVTTCSEATEALFLLREKGGFDLIMADIHMPDMDGFRLLELVGLDMDLPVIMMSADSRFNSVLKGLRRGACGFLCKPLRMEELQTIWQFVIKKKCQNNRGLEHSGSMDDSDGNRQVTDDTENALILNGVTNVSRRSQEKKRDDKEDGGEPDNADPPSKKPRVAWSFELHQQFVNAINQIGIDRAVPKRILDLMNVPGLTRAKVASHLQKFRLQLKKLSGIAKQNAELGNFLLWASLNADLAQLGKLDNRTMSILKKITPEALVALQEMSAINQPVQQQGSAQEINSLTSGQGIAFEKLLLKCKGVSSHFPVLPSNNLGVVGPADASTLGRLCAQNKDNPVTMLQHQQPNAVLSESCGPINMQPSCSVSPPQSSNCVQVHEDIVLLNENSMVVPLQSPATLQAGGVVTPVNPNSPVGASLLCTSSLTGNYPAMINHSSMLGPSQSMTRALVGNNPGQSSTGIPSKQWTHFHASSSSVSSQSSTAVQAENNLATANCNFVLSKDSLIMDYGQLSCQLNNVPVRMAQILVGSFKNPMAKGYSIPGSISSSLPFPFQSDSSNRQNPHGGIDDPDGSHCLVPDSCNARATSTLLGTMPDQGQGRSLGFVDKITCSPSWFLGDGNESPSDYLIHSEICTDPDEHVQDHHHSGCDKMA